MFNYSRCLHPDDYKLFDEHGIVTKYMNADKIYRYEHEHRKWEYGITIKFLNEIGATSVFDVGGGGSVLAPILAKSGMDIKIIDPFPGSEAIDLQNKKLGIDMVYIQENFLDYSSDEKVDAVVSISTIEHIPEYKDVERFIEKMFTLSKKGVFITMDLHPSGEPFSQHHYRTFTQENMKRFESIGNDFGFEIIGNPDWTYKGNYVYDYTFASIGMKHG